ncbi:MFS transporter [Pseudonocardia nematodicida]|uniref:MFS transporter n=1 Tax=Pseudonocardia nematodicida TaxID=1206997 RepID=A0ABV1KG95_9PSEU
MEQATGKIMRRIVPLFAVMMLCNQLNRSNIGYAQHYLEADLGIGAAAYGLGAGLFFIAYTIFEVPSNMLLERFGPRIWLSRICISWGLISAGMMFVQGPTSFYVLRFLLGVAEAGFVPAVLYFLTTWLPNAYRGRANARYAVGALLAFSLSGPLSAPLLGMQGTAGLHGWQWMFLVEGAASVCVGIFAFFWLNNTIADATWLTGREKDALTTALQEERRAVAASYGQERPRWYMTMRDPRIIVLTAIYFTVQMSIYANTFWLPSIVRGMGNLSDLSVGLLSSIPWVCAIGSMFLLARIGDRTGRRRMLLVGALLAAAFGSLGAAYTAPVLALVCLSVAAMGFKSISPIFWPIVQRSVHPVAVGFTVAIINSIANLGGFVAPYGFGLVQERTGSTQLGLVGLAILSLIAAFLCIWVRDSRTSGDPADGVAEPGPSTRPDSPSESRS